MGSHLVRLLRQLALALALAAFFPGAALAADPPAVSTGDPGAVTLLVALLLGSLTAGLFFASPLRRRMTRGAATSRTPPERSVGPTAEGLDRTVAARVYRLLARVSRGWPQLRSATPLPAMPGGDIFEDDPGVARALVRRAAVPGPASSPDATPWSTGPVASDERYLPSG